MKILPSNDIYSLYEKIINASDTLIVSHSHPDGDAVGSCAAMLSWIESVGSSARVILPDREPDCLGFITEGTAPGKISFFNADPQACRETVEKADLIIFLDMNHPSRTGEVLSGILEDSAADKVLIDHHPDPDRGRFSLVFSETETSSTCELLYYILKSMPGIGSAKDLPSATAAALMAGMTTDTNNFANSVFPTTLEMASELLEAGVDRDGIVARVSNSYGPDRIRLLGRLLDRHLKITPDGAARMILSHRLARSFHLNEGDTEGFVNVPLTVKDIRLSIFLTEEKDRFRVSIRSKRGIEANRLAALHFHGGGHVLAAGGRLMIPSDVKNVAEAEAYVDSAVRRFLNENNENETE